MTTHVAFLHGIEAINKGEIDLVDDTIKVMLLDNTLAPDQDAHDYIDDLNANEISGTGYSAGGDTLTTKAVTTTGASNLITFDADDAEWTGATLSGIRYAIIYKDTGTPATSPVISVVDFEADQAVTSGTFTIQWHANGILQYTAS